MNISKLSNLTFHVTESGEIWVFLFTTFGVFLDLFCVYIMCITTFILDSVNKQKRVFLENSLILCY